MSPTDTEHALVLGRARQAMLAQVRYFEWGAFLYESGAAIRDTFPSRLVEHVPAHVLSTAARYLYTDCLISEGGISVEAFEWYLDLEHGLLDAAA